MSGRLSFIFMSCCHSFFHFCDCFTLKHGTWCFSLFYLRHSSYVNKMLFRCCASECDLPLDQTTILALDDDIPIVAVFYHQNGNNTLKTFMTLTNRDNGLQRLPNRQAFLSIFKNLKQNFQKHTFSWQSEFDTSRFITQDVYYVVIPITACYNVHHQNTFTDNLDVLESRSRVIIDKINSMSYEEFYGRGRENDTYDEAATFSEDNMEDDHIQAPSPFHDERHVEESADAPNDMNDDDAQAPGTYATHPRVSETHGPYNWLHGENFDDKLESYDSFLPGRPRF